MMGKLTFGGFSREDAAGFIRLLRYIAPYKKRLLGALLAIMGVAAVESYLAAFISPLVNQGFALPQAMPVQPESTNILEAVIQWKNRVNHAIWGTENKVWLVPLFFLGLITFRGICRFISTYLLAWVGLVAVSQLRRDMFAKMLRLPSSYQQAHAAGEITGRFLVQAGTAINNASDLFITLTRDSMVVLGLVIVLLYLNWQLSLIVVMMFPVLSWLTRYYRNRLKMIQQNTFSSVGHLNNVINETHQGHRVVKMFGGYKNALNRFDVVNNTIVRLAKKMNQASSARSPFSELIASIALAIVIFIALWQSQTGITTIGDFMAFIVAMLQMVAPIKNLSNISIPMQAMFLASDDVCQFLDAPDEVDSGSQVLKRATGKIEFCNVSVRYPEQEKWALQHLDIHIRAGEKVALVGRSGSGKTTVVNLLPRFVSPVSGSIRVDNIPIEDITLTSLREQFALVSQDVFLFDDTLYQNVIYSRPEASDAQVEQALRAANLWDWVQEQEHGWHTSIGMNGNRLSGGQRQRVSIARAILKDAPILLLDEATSALDNESERLVQQALERLMHNRTSIIVAHRLSTIEQADRIIVMDDGRIVEQGSHAQLLAAQGYYAKLRAITAEHAA